MFFTAKYYKENFNEISKETRFLEEHYDFIPRNQRIWHFIHKDKSIHLCKMCGKPANFLKSKKTEYSNVCSKECAIKFARSSLYKTIYRRTSFAKYGTSNPMRNPIVRAKHSETNMSLYGAKNFLNSDFKKEGVENTFRSIFEKDGYTDLGYRYIRHIEGNKHEFYCPKCNSNFITKLYSKRRGIHEICTNCNPAKKTYSELEKQLSDFIKSFYRGEIQENTRKIIQPYELDVFLPELNIAIEFNGDVWHANPKIYRAKDYVSAVKKTAERIWRRDEIKKRMCEKRKITLIIVWERDWMANKEKIKKELKFLIK